MAKLKKHKLSKDVRFKPQKSKRISKEMVITIIIGGVMILSIFGIMFSSYNSVDNKKEYNGFDFVLTDQGWMTEIDGQRAYFAYSPSQVETLQIDEDVIEALSSPMVFIVFNPQSENIDKLDSARFTLAQALTLYKGKTVAYGITKEQESYDMPLYNCDNATAVVPVISMVEIDEEGIPESNNSEETGTKVYTEGNCVIFASRQRDWQPATERLVYGLLGII